MNEHERRQAAKTCLGVLAHHGIPAADGAILLSKVAGALAYRAQPDITKRTRLLILLGKHMREAADELEIAERSERAPRQPPRQREGAGQIWET